MDNELEVIRHQMEEKRASLADKLDALENQVMETVHEATAGVSQIVDEVKSTVGSVTEGVQDTVESVKQTLTEGVQDTVESVKQTFNVNERVRENPWLAMGGAFALGLVGGYVLGPSSRRSGSSFGSLRSSGWEASESARVAAPTVTPAARPTGSTGESFVDSTMSSLGEAGAEALTKVKEMAVGTLMGVLGQVVTDALPNPLKDEAAKLVKDLTTKLGGKVIDVSQIVESFSGKPTQEDSHDTESTAGRGRSMGPVPTGQRGNGREF